MKESCAVLNHVQQNFVGVKSVKKTSNEDVYCLATKKNGNFVANGIVVKNCDSLRYGLYTHFYAKENNGMSAIELDKSYYEAVGGGESNLPSFFQQPNYIH